MRENLRQKSLHRQNFPIATTSLESVSGQLNIYLELAINGIQGAYFGIYMILNSARIFQMQMDP